MKKISLSLIFLLLISNFIAAQKRSLGQFTHDIPGIFSVMLSGVGPAYLFGDVGGRIEDQLFLGSTDWDMTKTRFLYSIGFRQHFPNNFGLKGTLLWTVCRYRWRYFKSNARLLIHFRHHRNLSTKRIHFVRRTLRPSPHPKSYVYFCRSRYTQLSTKTY